MDQRGEKGYIWRRTGLHFPAHDLWSSCSLLSLFSLWAAFVAHHSSVHFFLMSFFRWLLRSVFLSSVSLSSSRSLCTVFNHILICWCKRLQLSPFSSLLLCTYCLPVHPFVPLLTAWHTLFCSNLLSFSSRRMLVQMLMRRSVVLFPALVFSLLPIVFTVMWMQYHNLFRRNVYASLFSLPTLFKGSERHLVNYRSETAPFHNPNHLKAGNFMEVEKNMYGTDTYPFFPPLLPASSLLSKQLSCCSINCKQKGVDSYVARV